MLLASVPNKAVALSIISPAKPRLAFLVGQPSVQNGTAYDELGLTFLKVFDVFGSEANFEWYCEGGGFVRPDGIANLFVRSFLHWNRFDIYGSIGFRPAPNAFDDTGLLSAIGNLEFYPLISVIKGRRVGDGSNQEPRPLQVAQAPLRNFGRISRSSPQQDGRKNERDSGHRSDEFTVLPNSDSLAHKEGFRGIKAAVLIIVGIGCGAVALTLLIGR